MTWSISGSKGVDRDFRPSPWVRLADDLESKAAAEHWLRGHAQGYVGYAIFVEPMPAGPARENHDSWETFHIDRLGRVVSSRTFRRL